MRLINTDFAIEIASPNLFIFTVIVINVLGKGEDSDIISELFVLKKLFHLYNTFSKTSKSFGFDLPFKPIMKKTQVDVSKLGKTEVNVSKKTATLVVRTVNAMCVCVFVQL